MIMYSDDSASGLLEYHVAYTYGICNDLVIFFSILFFSFLLILSFTAYSCLCNQHPAYVWVCWYFHLLSFSYEHITWTYTNTHSFTITHSQHKLNIKWILFIQSFRSIGGIDEAHIFSWNLHEIMTVCLSIHTTCNALM